MIDLNTHILSNPYDYQTENETISSQEDFLNKINNLLTSLIYSSQNVPDFQFMSDELKHEVISIEIPDDLSDEDLSKIYFYSKKDRFSKMIDIIKKVNLDNSLSDSVTVDDINSIIEELENAVKEINSLYRKSKFTTFSTILNNFDDIMNIINNSEYIDIIEWIKSYPMNMINSIMEQYGNSEDQDVLNALGNLLNKIYAVYKSIIYDLIQTKLFWINFINMIDINNDSFDYNMISNDTDFILDDILDLDDDDDIDFDEPEEDKNKIGIEDALGPGNAIKKVGAVAGKVKNAIAGIPAKVSRINKQFKLFRLKKKNHGFYMKYIGRIDGLYERYADEAPIKENGMKGDPVQILKDDAKDYIIDVSDKFTDLQIELLDMAKRFSTMSNPKEMLSYINRYCGMYKSEMEKAMQIPLAMTKATRFKIANIILEHNKIYGYNTESIVENGKIPPANHAMVSLFVERPDEQPFDQHVSDIIKDVSSFKLIASNEKKPIFETTQVCNNLISKGIQANDLKSLKKYKKENYRKVKSNIDDYISEEEKPRKAKSQYIKQTKNIWKGIQKSAEYMANIKSYIVDLVNGYFIMMMRIDNLCKECVTSLLNVERFRKDERYKTGFDADKKNDNNQYKQNEEKEYKNKATREAEREELRKSDYSEMKQSMRTRILEIKEAMKNPYRNK